MPFMRLSSLVVLQFWKIEQSCRWSVASSDRYIHLVLENDDNHATLLDPCCDPPQGRYRAQWNDDYHHAFHVLLTCELTGYYKDYKNAEALLARTLGEGFAYQGEPSPHRSGSLRGEVSRLLPATAFVNFLQNHDQIGNRALGERLTKLAPATALEAAITVTLLAPAPPLMFMGDEWGSQQPFPFFCDFEGELGNAVRRGRRRNSPRPTPSMGMKFSIRSRLRPCNGPYWTGAR